MTKANEKKLSLASLKEKAGKAFIDVNAVKGGVLADCHIQLPDPPIVKTDAV